MSGRETEMPAERRYTIAICKGAGLVDETRTLIQHWEPDEEISVFIDRVLSENLLARATARRTRDIVRWVFARRFLLPSDVPACRLKQILARGLSRKTFNEVIFLYAARTDPLVYDFTTKGFWPACLRGRNVLRTEDVLAFVDQATNQGLVEQPWSEQVRLKISRGVLRLLRDVGFLREERRGHREIVPYHVSDDFVAYLAYELHESGLSDSAMPAHPDWHLFGLDRERVLGRLEDLSHKGMLVQRAGAVVRITWEYQTVEELIDGLSG